MKSKDYKEIFKKGNRWSNEYFTLFKLIKKEEEKRSGVIINKKTGKSVERNRIKRLLKEFIRNSMDKLIDGVQLILIAKENVKDLGKKEIRNIIEDLFKGAGLYKCVVF